MAPSGRSKTASPLTGRSAVVPWGRLASHWSMTMSKEAGKGDNHGGGPGKIEIIVVVNGQPTQVEANPNQPLHVVRTKALENTQNVAQPAENWEFKDEAGTLLDADKKIGDFGFANTGTLFLSLKAGVAGA
ncbi:conserved hypothetical 13.6 kDa protein (plasmid) [Sinorhizobium fredii NGR234]|uniref:Uncharacterized protein y4jI n=2 Tax=Rhizobium fredii TaxID=380 RepID=Y4JI_SINFN|nr:RecName: Full=Uncharacterized protein y4jI [Sinorhizobium fredii NGR234]AAB91721.1 conserved hypothetical 13.6 kDa protein [Sinorhizobium fredii NGR234]